MFIAEDHLMHVLLARVPQPLPSQPRRAHAHACVSKTVDHPHMPRALAHKRTPALVTVVSLHAHFSGREGGRARRKSAKDRRKERVWWERDGREGSKERKT